VDAGTRDLLDRVTARAEQLADRDVARAEAQERGASAVRWRLAAHGSDDLVSPVPIVARWGRDSGGRWLEAGEREFLPLHVGYDAEDRPVVLQTENGFAHRMWRYADDHVEEVNCLAFVGYVVWLVDGGAVGVDASGPWVQRWTRDGEGRVVRVDRAGAAQASAAVAEYDAEGLWAVRIVEPVDGGLEVAAGLTCSTLAWDARRRRPEPLSPDLADHVPRLAAGLAEGIREAQWADGPPRAYVVEVELDGHGNPAPLPPSVDVGDVSWRDGVRERSTADGAALEQLYEGRRAGQVVRLWPDAFCDDETMRLCRALNTGLRPGARETDQAVARTVVPLLAAELTRRLNGPGAFPGAVAEFLAEVRVSSSDPALAIPRQVLDPAAVERFVASIASRSPALDLDPEPATRDRAALEELLRAFGLHPRQAQRIAHDEAEVGLLLVPDTAARSRLGGPGLLPRRTDWPYADGDRPLSFLAALDLSELPPGALPGAWPAGGWLLFFADLDNEEALGLIEPVSASRLGSPARMLVVPPGEEPRKAKPPRSIRKRPGFVLAERRVGFRPVLMLPRDYHAASRLRLSEERAVGFDAAVARLATVEAADERAPRHWVGGLAVGSQGEVPTPGTTLLLHLASDAGLDFEYLDVGEIQFRIPDAALAVADWSQVTAQPDSG
jgi:hypothetical protein